MRADINDFYGSIYTHSIEWALHTKAVAKSNIKGGQQLLGKIIDEAVRNGQDGQTKGIPVGPDTSLLLAELLLCEIDSELVRALPNAATSAIRMVDDIEFFASSRAEAEDFLTIWDTHLHAYDLSLNPKKTAILEGPVPHESSWSVALRQFVLRTTSDAALARDIREFFARAFELSRQFPDEPVLSYAISRTRSLPIEKESWQALQYAMLASITAEPSTLRHASPILGYAFVTGRDLDTTLIEGTLNEMCRHHAPFEHGSEVAWSLHILRMLKLDLHSSAAEKVAKMQDNSSLILLLDFVARRAITGALPDTSLALSRATDSSVHLSDDWLLGYEAGRNGWVGQGSFGSEAHWRELLDADVSFFRSSVSATSSATRLGGVNPPKPGPPKAAQPKPGPPKAAQPKPGPPKAASSKTAHTPSTPPPVASPAWSNIPVPSWVTAKNPWIDQSDYSTAPGEYY